MSTIWDLAMVRGIAEPLAKAYGYETEVYTVNHRDQVSVLIDCFRGDRTVVVIRVGYADLDACGADAERVRALVEGKLAEAIKIERAMNKPGVGAS